MILLRLYFEFFKTGLFAVGGGLATLPFLSDMADSTGWFTHRQLADMIAVSESTPGPIGINMATYAGTTTAGIPGAIAATLGLITPSVIIILIIAAFLKAFRDNPYVASSFSCLRPVSTGLIAAAGVFMVFETFFADSLAFAFPTIGFFRSLTLPDPKLLILAAALLILTRAVKFTKRLHPIIWIAASAAAGILFAF